MGKAVLSFPQFQDLEPDKAVKLFSDSFELKIGSYPKNGEGPRQVDHVGQEINHFVSMLPVLSRSYFLWARTWVNALESTPVRLIVTKFLGKYYGIEGVVVQSVSVFPIFLTLKVNGASQRISFCCPSSTPQLKFACNCTWEAVG